MEWTEAHGGHHDPTRVLTIGGPYTELLPVTAAPWSQAIGSSNDAALARDGVASSRFSISAGGVGASNKSSIGGVGSRQYADIVGRSFDVVRWLREGGAEWFLVDLSGWNRG